MLSVELTGTSSTTGGAIASVANPEGKTLQILRSYLLVLTASTGAANVNVGVGAAATTDASDMISALAVNSVTANTVYAGSVGGDATKDSLYAAPAPWTSTKYVNVTGSATTAGFTGRLYIEYIRLE
jgi:hypothetical protein